MLKDSFYVRGEATTGKKRLGTKTMLLQVEEQNHPQQLLTSEKAQWKKKFWGRGPKEK